MADSLSEALLALDGGTNESTFDPASSVITINNDLRTIQVPAGFVFGVYNDMNVLTVSFEMPRYYDDLDLSEFSIQINYLTASNIGNIYKIEDPVVGSDKISFDWVLDHGVFVAHGEVQFIVCLRLYGVNGFIRREFNTTIARGVVLEGLEVEDPDDPEQYSILTRLELLEERVTERANDVETKYYQIVDIATEAESTLSTAIEKLDEATEGIERVEEMFGSPLVASSAAAMTDQTKVYVYTGSETGYTAGNWYYYDGSAWTSGGVYNSQGINTDTTLTVSGMAADAKKTGDEITLVKQDISELESQLNQNFEEIIGKNICDQSKNVTGQINSSGSIRTNGDYALYGTSDFIELEANTDYVFTVFNPGTGNVGTGQRVISILYDDTKTPIDNGYQNVSSGGTLTFNSGSTAKYARVCSRGSYYFQLEKGTVNTSYEAYSVTYKLICLLGDAPLEQVNGKINTAIGSLGIIETVTGKNLVNPANLTTGFILSSGNISTEGSYANYSTSDYIPLDANSDYAFGGFNTSTGALRTDQRVLCLLFDSSKTVVSDSYQNVSSGGYLTFNSGATAKYARVCTMTTSNFQLEKGRTTPSLYEAYTTWNVEALPLGETPVSQVQNQIDESIQNSGIIQYEVGRNLVDPSKLVTGFITSTGNVSTTDSYADFSTSDYIPLDSNSDYVFTCYNESGNIRDKRVACLLFDDSKTPISNSHQNISSGGQLIFNSGITAKFARVSTTTANSIFQLEKGSTSAGLAEYSGRYVSGYPLGEVPFIQSQTGNILFRKKWAVCGDSFTAGATNTKITDDGTYKGYKFVYPYLIGNRNYMTIEKFFNGGQTLAFPAEPGDFVNSLTYVSGANYYQNIPSDVDYITIYLGINDANHATGSSQDGEDTTGVIPLGEITDATTATYYGAWNVVLTWLITNRPNAHIGMIVTNGNESNDSYRQAQIAIAQKYGIPYIDMNGDTRTPAMLRTSNPNIASAVKTALLEKWRVSSSNTHPNDAAHLYESWFIEEFLRSI